VKSIGLLFVLALLVTALIYTPGLIYAQTDSPVITPTVEVPPVPPDLPDDPIPIPPTLLELILELIQELGTWLTGILLGVIGISQKWVVSFVRRRFPNDDKSATRINGGVAEVFAGLTAIVLALITWGITFASGYASNLDLGSLVTLASVIFGSGYGMHKVNKLSTIAKALASK
jgi:hypothetical protein